MAARLNPHLNFNGDCEAPFRFYEQCLEGKITFMMTYGETPAAASVPSDWHNKIIHATLIIGDYMLQAADAPPPHYQKPQGMSVNLNIDDPGQAERVFGALADRAEVKFPIQETFWGAPFWHAG